MKAFDTDILTEILMGNPAYAERIAKVPIDHQLAPIVVVEEIIRGRLNVIRQAEAGKARITVEQSYRLFEQTLDDLRDLKILSFTEPGREAAERMAEEEDQRVHARSAYCGKLRGEFGHLDYPQSS